MFIVSDLNNLLSSDGTGQTFEIFAAGVQSIDFASKTNSNGTKLGVAEADDFKESLCPPELPGKGIP